MNTKEVLDTIGKRADAAIPRISEDYVENGILFCGKCHTAKQARVNVAGIDRLFASPCSCECDKDAALALKDKNTEREKRRRKTFHGIGSLCAATFTGDDGKRPELVAQLKGYVDIFERAKGDGYGLILCGAPGVGKTFHACQIANALIDRGKNVCFTDMYRLEDAILNARDRTAAIAEYSLYDLVILDNFGAWTKYAYDAGVIYRLVDHLYLSHTPCIITTDMTAVQLSELSGTSLYRRIFERAMLVPLDGSVNRSKINAQTNAAAYAAMLKL